MKRKLINYDVLERTIKDSLSEAEHELTGAAPILAKALGVNNIRLNCYGPNSVLFEATDGSYIRASFGINKQNIVFENIEQLVVDEETEKAKTKDTLSKVLDSILEDHKEAADALFDDYMKMPVVKRNLTEGKKCCNKAKKKKMDGDVEADKKEDLDKKLEFAIQKGKGLVKEWATIAKNVLDYVTFKEHGPTFRDSLSQKDEKGNVVSLQVPTHESRVSKKLIDLKWDHMLDTELEIKRGKAKTVAEDVSFCKACVELKRHNALSDNDALEETLVNIISTWPQVIYLTQDELAEQIGQALETAGASNYDDQICSFMAEGILRTAQSEFGDKVKAVVKLAGAEICDDCDQYEAFQNVVKDFYPVLDEAHAKQMQVYVDLYESLRKVYDISTENSVRVQTAGHLNELTAILKREMEPSLEVAQSAATWLARLVETNLEGSAWNVSNTPHQTVSGDHPAMAQKAKQGYTPASDFSGDWGDEAPVSDGKSYRGGLADEMRNRSWGNISNGETWPELSNPYVPKPFGDYSMKGEKGVDKASDATSQWSSEDTWPALQNPYVPKAERPPMKNGPETDLVQDM
jgi:hypothetical protein